ncbi:ABC transporter permease subunit [Micromonospora sp. 067-2]|uniref:ABC transporter permease subunit n=1 Tax=Micromonospora sp. 067-2 TaxID=2789270 RepID=UPI0039781A86
MSTWTRYRRLVGAESFKLRTVRRWVITLIALIPLTAGFALLLSSANKFRTGDLPPLVGPHGLAVQDQFRFLHQPMTGDGTIAVHVIGQRLPPQEREVVRENGQVVIPVLQDRAGAGIMIKATAQAGAAYAAIMVTPHAGVLMSSNFGDDITGPAASSPRWLRLDRAGTTITGYSSADGISWTKVATLAVPQLPATAQVGLFASSPDETTLEKSLGSTSLGLYPTQSIAEFDNLTVPGSVDGQWVSDDIGRIDLNNQFPDKSFGPKGSTRALNGTYTLQGTGTFRTNLLPDDPVEGALFPLFFGLMLLIPIAVLFITTEHKRPLLRLTFAASPHRGTVIAAKATVIAVTAFVLGTVAALASYAVSMPRMRANGYAPPNFRAVSLEDIDVWRAIFGSGALFAGIAVLALGLGAIMRRSAPAIATTIALVIVPMFVGTPLPLTATRWLMYLTPAGGFAMQRTLPPDPTLAVSSSMIWPWQGLAAVTGYAIVATVIAIRLTRKRDA